MTIPQTKLFSWPKKLEASVINHSLDDNFAAQRNWALSQAKTPWVLFVDADEIVPVKLGRRN